MKKIVLLLSTIMIAGAMLAQNNLIQQEESGISETITTQLPERDPNPSVFPMVPTDATYDLLFQFPVANAGGTYGVAANDENIFSNRWNATAAIPGFHKYNMSGTVVDSFSIAGALNPRDLAWDGQYFYGAANSTTIFKMDFATNTLVGTITAPVAVRGIAYDAVNDAFWTTNGWNGPLRLISRTGATLQTLTTVAASFSGLAWENVTSGGPYLWALTQPASNNILVKIDMTTGATLETYDVAGSVTFAAGTISGGFEITDKVYPGKWAFLGVGQNDVIWALELADGAPPVAPGAPTNLSVVAGAMGALEATISFNNPSTTVGGEPLTELTAVNIYRNDVMIHTITNPVIGGAITYVDNGVPSAGIYEYEVLGENTAGAGLPAQQSLYIGHDVPAAPGNVVLVAQGDDGLINWEAPTTGLNGGYFTNQNLTYDVVRFPGAMQVATNLTANSYLDTTIPGFGVYYYEVTANNHIGMGGTAASNSASLGGSLQGDYLAVISMPTGNKRVVLLNIYDGSLVLDNYINLDATGAGTPKDVIQVRNQIWVCDQIGDRIDRFDMYGVHLGVIGGGTTGGMDNIRGMGIVGNEVWLSNAGTANGAPGNATIRINFDGQVLGNFPVQGSPWDYIIHNNEALLSFSAASPYLSRIERYDFNGTALGSWNTPGELNFIQQISNMSNNNVLAAGFSTPAGVYQYDPQGVMIGMIPGTNSGPRGCYQLGNGNILWTNGSGIHIVDINTGVSTNIISGSAQLCDKITFEPVNPVVPGDANCDGNVNVIDVITIVNYILGLNPEPFCFDNADVNLDGNINVMDIIGTVNIILGGK